MSQMERPCEKQKPEGAERKESERHERRERVVVKDPKLAGRDPRGSPSSLCELPYACASSAASASGYSVPALPYTVGYAVPVAAQSAAHGGQQAACTQPHPPPQSQPQQMHHVMYPMPSPVQAPGHPAHQAHSAHPAAGHPAHAGHPGQHPPVAYAASYVRVDNLLPQYCEHCARSMRKKVKLLAKWGVTNLQAHPHLSPLQIVEHYYQHYKKERRKADPRKRSSRNSDSDYFGHTTCASSSLRDPGEDRLDRPDAPLPPGAYNSGSEQDVMQEQAGR
eukprot:TRINITY_DN9775_c0_g1_i1.p1 TRINITY_DN9775_c0_g1~~TRINITY_DN9775_c0_g1_i1.p1  ORF type:complete len:278 (+),score=50.23 TRINITY_DN9775_c0_g1_i1:131-964(+)